MRASRKELYESANEILRKDKFFKKRNAYRVRKKRKLTRKTDKYR